MDNLVVGKLVISGTELEERFDTSGGPGGQHANRTESAVTLRLDIAGSSLPDDVKSRLRNRYGEGIEVKAADSRSQSLNRKIARERMAGRIEEGLKSQRKRRATKPSKAAREKRLADKKIRAQHKRFRRKPTPDD